MNNALLKTLYGTDKEQEIYKIKESEKQFRAMAGGKLEQPNISADECKRLCKAVNNFEYLNGYEGRIYPYKITDETVDRYGDIVVAAGGDLKNYKKNPVVQFAHNYDEPPVGVSIKTWYDNETNCVMAWALFYDDRVDKTGRSDLIYRFVKSNGMRACSIGFVPVETWRPKNDEEKESSGLGAYGVKFNKWEMLEFSPCPVPANPSALGEQYIDSFRKTMRKSISSGLITSKDAKTLRKYPLFETGIMDALWSELDEKSFISLEPAAKNTDDTLPADTVEIKDEENVLKPYPNEHACRLNDPDKYDKFRRGEREHEGKKYSIIYGRIKESEKWEQQSFRYSKDEWKEKEAREHCTKSNGKFEPSSQSNNIADSINVNLNVDMSKSIDDIYTAMRDVKTTVEKLQNDINKNIVPELHKKVEEKISTAKEALAADFLDNGITASYSQNLYDEVFGKH